MNDYIDLYISAAVNPLRRQPSGDSVITKVWENVCKPSSRRTQQIDDELDELIRFHITEED